MNHRDGVDLSMFVCFVYVKTKNKKQKTKNKKITRKSISVLEGGKVIIKSNSNYLH